MDKSSGQSSAPEQGVCKKTSDTGGAQNIAQGQIGTKCPGSAAGKTKRLKINKIIEFKNPQRIKVRV